MKLDRSRPYAETIGPSIARYHQDGRDFDYNGEEINPTPAVTFVEPPEVVSVPMFVPTAAPEPVKRNPGRPAKVAE